jgi:hypothetical protein
MALNRYLEEAVDVVSPCSHYHVTINCLRNRSRISITRIVNKGKVRKKAVQPVQSFLHIDISSMPTNTAFDISSVLPTTQSNPACCFGNPKTSPVALHCACALWLRHPPSLLTHWFRSYSPLGAAVFCTSRAAPNRTLHRRRSCSHEFFHFESTNLFRLTISNRSVVLFPSQEEETIIMISLNETNNLNSYGSMLSLKSSSSASSSNGFLSKYSMALPTAIASLADTNHLTPLDDSYQPGAYDVVCGRGKGSYNRPGNKRFRSLVATYIPQYIKARSKVDKSMVLNNIIDKVHSFTNPDSGRPAQFVKYTKQAGWVLIGDEHAREKVGHAIREAIAAVHDSGRPASPKSTISSTDEDEERTQKQFDLLSQQQFLFAHMRSSVNRSSFSSERTAVVDSLLVGV